MQRLLIVSALLLGGALSVEADSWPQFRAGNAVADGNHKLPAEIGPDTNVLWKVALPPGHSSPIVHGDRVYVTALRDQALLTMALDGATGKLLWQAEAPHKELEKIHKIGSYVQPTPATDGQRIVSCFGSAGLFCYDRDGKVIWSIPMGPFKNEFGAGASPLIVDDRVILNGDHDSESFLLAVNKTTGKQIWKTDRGEFRVGYATPVIWEVGGKKQIVVCGTLRVVGYDFETGKEIWTVRNLSRIINMTPAIGPDNTLYVGAWAPGGEPGQRISLVSFAEFMAKNDANKNGTIEIEEVPAGPFKDRFVQIDGDKDGHVTRQDYESMRDIFDKAQNRLVAIKPGGTGDVTDSHVLWGYLKDLPYVPSPVVAQGYLFYVKNGGIVTSLDARSGKPTKTERVRGSGDYYASPVTGDGKVYMVSKDGDLNVLDALAGDWKVLHSAEFSDEVYATPAIADGKIYLRTRGHLYCFGLK